MLPLHFGIPAVGQPLKQIVRIHVHGSPHAFGPGDVHDFLAQEFGQGGEVFAAEEKMETVVVLELRDERRDRL